MRTASRTLVTVVLLLAVSCGLIAGSAATAAGAGFSLATLNGAYVFRVTGTNNIGTTTTNKPFAAIGLLQLDGAGHAKLGAFQSENGSFSTTSFTGTYTVNADGSGGVALTADAPATGTISIAIVIDDTKGSGFQILSQGTSEVIAGHATKR